MVKCFIVKAGELIKMRYNFHNALREFGVEAIYSCGRGVNQFESKPFIVEAGELIGYNFQSALWPY